MLCQLAPEEKSHDISTFLSALVTFGIHCNDMRYTLCLLIIIIVLMKYLWHLIHEKICSICKNNNNLYQNIYKIVFRLLNLWMYQVIYYNTFILTTKSVSTELLLVFANHKIYCIFLSWSRTTFTIVTIFVKLD